MPSEEGNIQYLYLVLTAGGAPNIDWSAVTADLAPLKIGAVKKRWSRLKQDIEKSKAPPAHAQQLLWLCVKHSSRDKPLDWNLIAEKCGTTPGAASKRYSRMKQAFENGTAVAPGSGSAKSAATDGKDAAAATGSKRKRATGKGKETNKEKNPLVADDEGDDEEVADGIQSEEVKKEEDKPKPKPKRARTTKEAATNAEDEGDDEEPKTEKEEDKPKPKRARTTKKAAAVKKENLIKSTEQDGDGDEDVKNDNEQALHGQALPSAQLIGELEAAVRDAQAKYHSGDGEAAAAEGELNEAEKKEMAESCVKVEFWLKGLHELSLTVF